MMHTKSADQALTLRCIKKSLKPNLKSKEGVCLPNPSWELVPGKRSLNAEGSASHSTLGTTTGQ